MLGDPDEIGKFVKFIVENKIKYITGSTIFFDGNLTKSLQFCIDEYIKLIKT